MKRDKKLAIKILAGIANGNWDLPEWTEAWDFDYVWGELAKEVLPDHDLEEARHHWNILQIAECFGDSLIKVSERTKRSFFRTKTKTYYEVQYWLTWKGYDLLEELRSTGV